MIIKNVKMENYTVFQSEHIEFSHGINVIIGENGTGKTNLLKLLYAACKSVDKKTFFPQKLVYTMLPDNYKINHLITKKSGNRTANICITAGELKDKQEHILSISFHNKTQKYNAEVSGKAGWEESFTGVNSVFIPAKEILSHSFNLNAAAEMNNIHFDDTYLDIINAAKIDISAGRNCVTKDVILKQIQQMTNGTVVYDANKDEFYLKNGKSKQEFTLVTEGIRKLALLWQLIKNGAIEKGDILFWDEPEANINPNYISVIVEILLELHRSGVQIFISTHDYMLASYFDVKKTTSDSVLFHSLSIKNEPHYECSEKFTELKYNPICNAFNQLLEEIYNIEV